MREELLSVGIDIGTSTTQLIFSKLIIENMASSYTVPRIVIVDKEIIYKSPIYFTPLVSLKEIDGPKVREIIEKEYKNAGVDKKDIDTGAVIITGETARKQNAEEVLTTLSGFAGDFVVATAGPDLESIISGKGAGAHIYSKENSTTVVNIDIGGGTSNLAVFKRGDVKDTGCLDIGGRLIKVDTNSKRMTYIAPKLETLVKKYHLGLEVGTIVTKDNLRPIIDIMVRVLMQSVGLVPIDEDFKLMVTNKSILLDNPMECISFSGGVADYIYYDEKERGPIRDYFEYGDIGILLGEAIRGSELCSKLKVVKSTETIRATVVGAGTHTTEISGSTITYTKNAFPIKNLPILKMAYEDENSGAIALAEAVKKKLEWFKLEGDLQRVAIAIEGKENPSFKEVQAYADGLVEGMQELIERELPLILIVEKDMAKVLGQTMYNKLSFKKDVICLDSVKLDNGDYIDIGNPIAEGTVLPVVVKTLVFN
ncbi:ethanolamine ammonia-lyase reactivating factor EutA [Cellulosilyticum lentocellum]|uniref:Ethanolamine utilization EutA n=1 Tax=Cellulosilyticum lentocellum (strain ATCC 49066 / DSM 5427 / NCIMB 11756 / RHM5) TaxID=642492 RepID=F2JLY9_CELLD|nr:ethanolamine ammonia-lyase reactivating factor EutA [Cellulosilyticum lentocellum]ADZ85769.1 Ethanolamine utilization EutA [Cellulosilyticum lentocellum DSM 5427]